MTSLGTRCRNATPSSVSESTAVSASPSSGNSAPRIGSSPMRSSVPGIRMALSSKKASRRAQSGIAGASASGRGPGRTPPAPGRGRGRGRRCTRRAGSRCPGTRRRRTPRTRPPPRCRRAPQPRLVGSHPSALPLTSTASRHPAPCAHYTRMAPHRFQPIPDSIGWRPGPSTRPASSRSFRRRFRGGSAVVPRPLLRPLLRPWPPVRSVRWPGWWVADRFRRRRRGSVGRPR